MFKEKEKQGEGRGTLNEHPRQEQVIYVNLIRRREEINTPHIKWEKNHKNSKIAKGTNFFRKR